MSAPHKTQAELRYVVAYEAYVHAKKSVMDAETKIMEERGISLPYVGPMKRKIRAHEERITKLQLEVHEWLRSQRK